MWSLINSLTNKRSTLKSTNEIVHILLVTRCVAAFLPVGQHSLRRYVPYMWIKQQEDPSGSSTAVTRPILKLSPRISLVYIKVMKRRRRQWGDETRKLKHGDRDSAFSSTLSLSSDGERLQTGERRVTDEWDRWETSNTQARDRQVRDVRDR